MLFVLLLRFSLYRLALHWMILSMGVFSVNIIASGVVSPITMVSFPSMETLQPERFSDQPDIARSQIKILITNETDEFDPIPDVTFRNHYWLLYHQLRSHIHRSRSHIHRWRSHNYRSEERRVGKECRSRGAPYHSK